MILFLLLVNFHVYMIHLMEIQIIIIIKEGKKTENVNELDNQTCVIYELNSFPNLGT